MLEAYGSRAVVYSEQKKWNLALADLNKAIQLNPNGGNYYYVRGLVYEQLGKANLAQADYRKARELGYRP